MSSFSKMSVWPVGYFRAFSSWLLRNRRTIASRIDKINADLARIGFVKVTYRVVDVDGEAKPTEERVGFSVTDQSSLGRLLQAYIAGGGNPLDISSFMYPDSVEILEEDPEGNLKTVQRYPHGGLLAPISVDYNNPLPKEGDDTGFGDYRGGYVRSDRYYPARQGGRLDRGGFDVETVVSMMHNIRAWANQDIRERLQDIEWRIIKLSDLREQLVRERDDLLVQAFGGVLSGVGDFDGERFDPDQRVQALVQGMSDLIYETDDAGQTIYRAHPEVPFLHFTFEDTTSELRDPLGG
jgi:hypothetical protein